ncbi:MAG: hypothetical protein V1815_00245 [Candidatus Woesearchaeota archaeon]
MDINSTTAKKLIIKLSYDKVYSEVVKSNGGNSGKINCEKEFIDREVIVFVLKEVKKK